MRHNFETQRGEFHCNLLNRSLLTDRLSSQNMALWLSPFLDEPELFKTFSSIAIAEAQNKSLLRLLVYNGTMH